MFHDFQPVLSSLSLSAVYRHLSHMQQGWETSDIRHNVHHKIITEIVMAGVWTHSPWIGYSFKFIRWNQTQTYGLHWIFGTCMSVWHNYLFRKCSYTFYILGSNKWSLGVIIWVCRFWWRAVISHCFWKAIIVRNVTLFKTYLINIDCRASSSLYDKSYPKNHFTVFY